MLVPVTCIKSELLLHPQIKDENKDKTVVIRLDMEKSLNADQIQLQMTG